MAIYPADQSEIILGVQSDMLPSLLRCPLCCFFPESHFCHHVAIGINLIDLTACRLMTTTQGKVHKAYTHVLYTIVILTKVTVYTMSYSLLLQFFPAVGIMTH